MEAMRAETEDFVVIDRAFFLWARFFFRANASSPFAIVQSRREGLPVQASSYLALTKKVGRSVGTGESVSLAATQACVKGR